VQTVNKAGQIRDWLEHSQIAIYFVAVAAGCFSAMLLPGTARLESAINPALALMLYVTFLQVPVAELGGAFTRVRFILPLLLTNFLLVPLLVAVLVSFLSQNPLLILGVLLVLLTPCIDYVVTFSQLGRADARLLLASTPVLLIVQILLLPVYLHLFLGENASELVQPAPFIHAYRCPPDPCCSDPVYGPQKSFCAKGFRMSWSAARSGNCVSSFHRCGRHAAAAG